MSNNNNEIREEFQKFINSKQAELTNQENKEIELIDDFDAPENCEYVEIYVEQLKCGDKYYIRQYKNYYSADGSKSYVVKIDGCDDKSKDK